MLRVLQLVAHVVVAPISPRYSLAQRLAAATTILIAGTASFYWVPALEWAPAYGDAGHFWPSVGDAALVELVMLLMLRFVIKPGFTDDATW